MGKFLVVVLVACLFQHHAEVLGSPRVTLPGPGLSGVLTGVTIRYEEPEFLAVDKSIDAYLGVRYAEPPVGDLRFVDPVPHVIQGEYNATYDRATCMQAHLDDDDPTPIIPGLRRDVDEDCLFLSIYTPSPKVSLGMRVEGEILI